MLMMGISPRVPRLLERFGPGRVGPLGLGAMARASGLLDAGTDSSYWLVLAGLVLLGVGAALATTPATTAIVSSLPPAKQGVASAVNDAAREVGGALGIAVLGSALADGYGSGVAGAVAARHRSWPTAPSRRCPRRSPLPIASAPAARPSPSAPRPHSSTASARRC